MAWAALLTAPAHAMKFIAVIVPDLEQISEGNCKPLWMCSESRVNQDSEVRSGVRFIGGFGVFVN